MIRLWVDVSAQNPDNRSHCYGCVQVPTAANGHIVNEISDVIKYLNFLLISQVDETTANLFPGQLSFSFLILTPNSSIDLVMEYLAPREQCCDACHNALKRLVMFRWLTYLHSVVDFPNGFSEQTNFFMKELVNWLSPQILL